MSQVAHPIVQGNRLIGYAIECPACKNGHLFYTEIPNPRNGAKWVMTGTLESPTFSPSIVVTCDSCNNGLKQVCHSFVEDGHIRYLDDCTHEFRGKRVRLV